MAEGIIPVTYEQVLEFINDYNLTIISGGTDLMVKYKSKVPKFENDIIFVGDINELNFVKVKDGFIYIGSNVRLNELLNYEEVPNILKEAIKEIGSPAIRNIGTIGGNIANASPAGDTLPILYILDTYIVLESINGIRQIPIEDFIVAPGKVKIARNEIIKGIVIKEIDFDLTYYKKVGPRKKDAISKVSFIGAANYKSGKIIDFRVAFGAVGPRVVRNEVIERELVGFTKDKLIRNKEDIIEDYQNKITPISDVRSTARYRKKVQLKS